ncbi:MAG: DUF302 domain-containing protein [Gammaproteobacteria bacterium]|nr:MAG: DUF302 domain-containing protein [Gammaproteobacteria bacterium]
MVALASAHAAESPTRSGYKSYATGYSFDQLVARVQNAVQKNRMGLVAQASASRGAAARGVKIRGNFVIMVFRNDYAVRMLKASVPAGIEAPLRFYLTENEDGTTELSYYQPSAVFAPYGSSELDVMAGELDLIFAQIVADAVGK